MYKQKLIDLLKSDKQTKEAMEKLEFWCILKFWIETCSIISKFNSYNVLFHTDWLIWFIEEEDFKKYEIIWLPLQERFIRMYCEFQWKDFNFSTHWWNTLMLLWDKDIPPFLDNTKDFDNQDDIVYQRIYEALYNLNK